MDLRLERLSAEMEYATVTAWRVAEGDAVTAGQAVAEVEADKVVEEIASPVDGIVAEIVAAVGDELPVGSLLAVIREGAP